MLNQLSIRVRLAILAAMASLALLVLGGVNYQQTRHLTQALQTATQAQNILRNQSEADMMHDAVRGDVLEMYYRANQANASPQALDAVRKMFAEHAKELREHINKNDALPLSAQARRELDALKPDLEAYLREAEAALNTLAAHGDAQQAYAAFSKRFEALEKSMGAFSDTLERASQAEQEQAGAQAERTSLSLAAALFLCMAGLITLDVLLGRSIVRSLDDIRRFLAGMGNHLDRRLHSTGRDEVADIARAIDAMLDKQVDTVRMIQHAADALRHASGQVSSQSQTANVRSADIARTMSALTAAAEQMRAGVNNMAQAISSHAAEVRQANQANQHAEEAMQASRESSQGLVDATRQLGAMMTELNDAVSRIGAMAQVINDIADQTNLLALNAAIEAARAGEQGRGFAVVADEVRKLAERTSSSTGDISAIIQSIRVSTEHAAQSMGALTTQVEDGLSALDQARLAQETITGHMHKIHQVADEVAGATRQQAAAMDDNANGMQHIQESLQVLQGVVEQLDDSANELTGEAKRLADHAGAFQTGGAHGAAARPSPAKL